MIILLDECVDWRFGRSLSEHDVSAAFREGWSGTKNGELLELAAPKFDVLVTVDQNLPYQQSIQGLDIAILILDTRSTRLVDLEPIAPTVREASRSIKSGEVVRVGVYQSVEVRSPSAHRT